MIPLVSRRAPKLTFFSLGEFLGHCPLNGTCGIETCFPMSRSLSTFFLVLTALRVSIQIEYYEILISFRQFTKVLSWVNDSLSLSSLVSSRFVNSFLKSSSSFLFSNASNYTCLPWSERTARGSDRRYIVFGKVVSTQRSVAPSS